MKKKRTCMPNLLNVTRQSEVIQLCIKKQGLQTIFILNGMKGLRMIHYST